MRQVKSLEPEVVAGPSAASEESGFGVLKTERGGLPLVAMDVSARISGLTAEVRVRQTYRDALDEALEATYIFPLPDRAAVTAFRMEVAGRIVEGDLKERGEAREEYEKAIEAGHRAAIAEEERSGTFSLRVGNIPAKEQVTIELTLVGPVAVADGEATFRFPLVVAPRYIPGIPLDGPPVGTGWGADTDQAVDASRVTPPVLLPGFPNPVRLSLEVEIDPAGLGPEDGDWCEQIRASLHSVVVDRGPPWMVRLQPGERLNRDFILRFPVAGEALQATLLCSPHATTGKRVPEPGTFALTLVPPKFDERTAIPRDVAIVLDRSGSMQGWKMVAARRAVGRMFDTLLDHDRFTVLAFDNSIEYPPHADKQLVVASDQNRWRALEWLGKVEARGGTEMGPAVEEAVRQVHSPQKGRQAVVVLITDGQVAGEDSVLRSIKKAAGSNMPRIHTLGIDQAANEGFLHRLADLGGGTCDLVESEGRLDDAMDHIHRGIGVPVLTGLALQPEKCELVEDGLAPSRLPELFSGRPVTIFGRFRGDAAQLSLRVEATNALGLPWSRTLTACPRPAASLLNLWGRVKVRELEDRYAVGSASDPKALAKQIVQVSLESRVLSRFTAYVAVDRSEVVNQGGEQKKILQPVEMPAGWEMAEAGVLCCMAAAPAAGGFVGYGARAAVGPLLRKMRQSRGIGSALRLIGGSTLWSPAPRTIADVVKDIRSLLAKTKYLGRLKPKATVEHLAAIVAMIDELASLLRQSGHPAPAEIEKVLSDGQSYVAELAASSLTTPDAAKLQEFFSRVVAILDTIEKPPEEKPERKEFWT
jgi:Ca-activated chloride channel family protein